MRRALSGVVFLVLLALPIAVLAQVSQVHLGWSENNVYETMTVMWYSPMTSDQGQWVYYDLVPGGCPPQYEWELEGVPSQIAPAGAVASFDGFYYRAKLEGLVPGQTYYFRVVDKASGEMTREWSFRTIGVSQQFVRFAFAGDSQRPFITVEDGEFGQLINRPNAPANWPYMRDFLTEKAASADPDFVLVLGDLVARGCNQDQWDNWFNAWQDHAVADSCRMIPIVPVIGNHEMGGYPDIDSTYEWFMGLFAMPEPVAGMPCYALDFPNLHLTVLAASGGQIKVQASLAAAEANAQVNWLESDLSSAPAVAWKLVALHCNYLGCFKSCLGYACDEYMFAWTKLFQTYSVDAVLMGHTHNYTRSWPILLPTANPCIGGSLGYDLMGDSNEGITYIVSGTWGGVTNPILSGGFCDVRDWIAAAASHPAMGFAQVEASQCHIQVEDTSGFSIDGFTLPYQTSSFTIPAYTEVIP